MLYQKDCAVKWISVIVSNVKDILCSRKHRVSQLPEGLIFMYLIIFCSR